MLSAKAPPISWRWIAAKLAAAMTLVLIIAFASAAAQDADRFGDPLPAGAMARLGSVRFRHAESIHFLAFTPDGKRLVSQDGDSVRIWDAATGKELHHFEPEAGKRWEVGSDLSPDGKLLAASALSRARRAVELWDVNSGKKVGSVGERLFLPVRFSPDGKLLAAVSRQTTIVIWDIAARKKLRSWKAHPNKAFPVAFSADSRKLLSRGRAGEVRLWDVATGRQLQECKPLDETRFYSPGTSALSPDGSLLALIETNEKQTTADGKVVWKTRVSVWNATTGQRTQLLSYPAYEIDPGRVLPVSGMAFAPDGKVLLTAGPDRFLRLWNLQTGKEIRRLPLAGLPTSLILSRDGKKAAVSMMGNTVIRVLDLQSGRATTSPRGHLGRVVWAAFTPDGRTAVTGTPRQPLLVWDVTTGRVQRRLEGHSDLILTRRLSSDGRTLFTRSFDKVRIWDFATGKERRRILVKPHPMGLLFSGLALTPDDKTLAVLDGNKTIRIFDVSGSRERQHFSGPEVSFGMKLTADGRSLIAWSADYKVGVWDTATGRKLREFSLPKVTGLPENFYHARLSPDAHLLAMGPMSYYRSRRRPPGFLIVKELATGRVVHRIDNLPGETAVVAFSPNGQMLAWAGFDDPAIRLLEVASGRERRRLHGHRGEVSALTFSADGRRLITGCSDTTALVWDLAGEAPAKLTTDKVETLWGNLASEDAALAYRAIQRLAAAPDASVPYLRKRLHPIPLVSVKRIAALIADLDSDDFAVRRKATATLKELAEQPMAAYRKALEGKPSLEMRRRLEDLLAKAERAWWGVSGKRLRSLRAIETLELIGNQEARKVLALLAEGAPAVRLTEQAKAALQRLNPGLHAGR